MLIVEQPCSFLYYSCIIAEYLLESPRVRAPRSSWRFRHGASSAKHHWTSRKHTTDKNTPIDNISSALLHIRVSLFLQPGAVKLALWRHWMHETQVHPMMPENQFHCTRLYMACRLCTCLVSHLLVSVFSEMNPLQVYLVMEVPPLIMLVCPFRFAFIPQLSLSSLLVHS